MEKEKTAKQLLNQRLSLDELQIIEHKGTERPGVGAFVNHHEKGLYTCRRCHAPLYLSKDKFDSSCGWPSFDDELEGAVERKMDADGSRTEILCAACGAHLGHVFVGEQFTAKNVRHCVNSISMNFVPAEGETGRAVFAGGCFWGVEYYLAKLKGVSSTTVGYCGGDKPYPSYEEVCRHKTGHLESIEVEYDPDILSFEDLTKYFFEIHDPTQTNGQGPDIGPQYLSAVFYQNLTQKETAENILELLRQKGIEPATQILPAAAFWPAELYHQDYYTHKGSTPYCHAYKKRF